MAETIRIEIPIETVDKTDPGVSNATKKLGKLGDAADKAGQSVDRSREYVSKFDEQANKTQQSLAKWAKEKYQIYLEAKENISPVLDTIGGGVKSLAGKTWSFTLKALDFATTPVRTLLNLLKNPLLQAGAFFGVSLGLTDTINTQKDFEAAMSQVQAVSGADSDELEQLTKKAEEMGATTKFTATDSAEAFNYMAMAGWKTEDMLDGISGIMQLAAAANEDLGTTSDIVTDALTAFGLKASDAGMFSDVLAAASSNANTNVSMMGETFKFAASMAGSLGYSVQDVALMTGLMANSGIKASMAGTALNSIMTRLSTNTHHARDTLEELGIKFFDAQGNARPLVDVMEELRDATANMNDEQKPNVADWTNSDVVEWFDLNGMDAETQAALVERLKAVADSMPASFADSIRGSGLGKAARDAVDDELDAVSATKFKKDVYAQFNLHSSMNSVVAPSSSGSSSYTSQVTGKTVTPYAAGYHGMSIGGHATGGMVNGRELSWVGEEGPEMIIPLVPARRERAVELYQQAGEILGVTAHANGGLVGSGSSSYTSPVTRNYMDSYYDGHTSHHNEFSSDTVDYLSQTVNEAPVASNLFSEDDSTASTSSSSQNVASTSQNVTVRPEVTVKVDVNPEFNITGGEKSEDEIMAVIRRHMKEMADEIGGELATKLDEVFSNMPLKGVSA